MNEKHRVPTLYESSPAIAALNKISGFDPFKFLRRSISEISGEEILVLDFSYKKLWFRLAYPHGRIKLSALQITEQFAMIEAKVFFDRNDTEPVGNFIATCTREESADGKYVEAAQNRAMDQALSDAGFGLQFADIGIRRDEEYCTNEDSLKAELNGQDSTVNPSIDMESGKAREIPQEQRRDTEEKADETVKHDPGTAEEKTISAIEDAPEEEMDMEQLPVAPEEPESVVERRTGPMAAGPEPETEPASTEAPAEPEVNITPSVNTAAETDMGHKSGRVITLQFADHKQTDKAVNRPESNNMPEEKATEAASAVSVSGESIQPTVRKEQILSYTADMPVEEILKYMTLEEAKNVYVDVGTCNGWTMEQVAERRPPSLKWYIYGYKEDNNILRAAAKIMLDSLSAPKAS